MFPIKFNQNKTNRSQHRPNDYLQIEIKRKSLIQIVGIYAFIMLLFSTEVILLSGEQEKSRTQPYQKLTDKEQLNERNRGMISSFCLYKSTTNTRYTLHCYSSFSISLLPSYFFSPLLLPTTNKLLISSNSHA